MFWLTGGFCIVLSCALVGPLMRWFVGLLRVPVSYTLPSAAVKGWNSPMPVHFRMYFPLLCVLARLAWAQVLNGPRYFPEVSSTA